MGMPSTFGNHPSGVISNGVTQEDRLPLRLEVEGQARRGSGQVNPAGH